jgi:hypothetical protein
VLQYTLPPTPVTPFLPFPATSGARQNSSPGDTCPGIVYVSCPRVLSLPACGERAGERGSHTLQILGMKNFVPHPATSLSSPRLAHEGETCRVFSPASTPRFSHSPAPRGRGGGAKKCDNYVTNMWQFCDIGVYWRHEHRFCGHSVGSVLGFDGCHSCRLWRLRLVLPQAPLPDQQTLLSADPASAPPSKGSEKGSPIRALVNRKNVVPSGFLFRFAPRRKLRLQSRLDPAFSFHLIPHPPRRAIARRGDPFSHPSGSSAVEPVLPDPHFGPKGAGRDRSGSRLPPARFSGSSFFYSRGAAFGKPRSHWLCAQWREARHPENLQCRAVFIQYQRVLVPWQPRGFRGPTRS